jgi:hypothetical protein
VRCPLSALTASLIGAICYKYGNYSRVERCCNVLIMTHMRAVMNEKTVQWDSKNTLPPIPTTLFLTFLSPAVIAQLGERKTEDLKVSGSIPDCGKLFFQNHFFTGSIPGF